MKNETKKKPIKLVTISGLVILLILVIIAGYIFINGNMEDNEILYNTTYYFGLGSRNVKIYKNGEIYDDLEIEEPNHNPQYKYLKTLTTNELSDLIDMIQNESNSEKISEYVMQLVYGVKEFDIYGGY